MPLHVAFYVCGAERTFFNAGQSSVRFVKLERKGARRVILRRSRPLRATVLYDPEEIGQADTIVAKRRTATARIARCAGALREAFAPPRCSAAARSVSPVRRPAFRKDLIYAVGRIKALEPQAPGRPRLSRQPDGRESRRVVQTAKTPHRPASGRYA